MKDHLSLNYTPKFINLLKDKPKLSAQKKQLIIYYLSSYFLKKTKKELQDIYDHHCFYWNTKNELILHIKYIIGNSDFFDKSKSYSCESDKEIPNGSHTEFNILYNFSTNKIAIQGYLVDRKKHISYYDNEKLEDIEQFTDYDFNRILSYVPVDYHIRDEQIKIALDDILESFPVNRFYTYRNSSYCDHETIISYLYKRVRNKDSIILYFNRYSIDNENLDEKKKDKYEVHFLRKDKFISDHKIELKEDIYVKEKIYKHRESVIKDLKNHIIRDQEAILKHESSIKMAQTNIEILNKDIEDTNKDIEKKINDLNNTIIEDIKIL